MTQTIPNRQIAEEAADWAVRLDAGALDAAERRALAQWLAASPVHVDELLYSTSIFAGMEHVDSGKHISIDALLATHAPEVVPLFVEARRQAEKPGDLVEEIAPVGSGFASNMRWAAIAATLVLAVLGAGYFRGAFWQYGGDAAVVAYETKTGEQRSITLEDGSILQMNTGSSVHVTFSGGERRVDLLSGEALFDVAHDTKRPFRVYAGDTVSQAVGTKFNVQRDGRGVHVVVVEGKVLVQNRSAQSDGASGKGAHAVLVLAGNRADIEQRYAMPQLSAADLSDVTLWPLRQLSFENQTLASIAAEFNRYNHKQLIAADPQLANTRFSGEFNASDPESFLDFLELTPGIRIDRSDPDRVVLMLEKR